MTASPGIPLFYERNDKLRTLSLSTGRFLPFDAAICGWIITKILRRPVNQSALSLRFDISENFAVTVVFTTPPAGLVADSVDSTVWLIVKDRVFVSKHDERP
jgi:hypothetical protein